MINPIACGAPGKIGDVLYCLPTIKELCTIHNKKCDFYTSPYCAPLKELFLSQSYINNFFIDDTYVLKHDLCGFQPREVKILENYSHIYQLGFKSFPNCELHKFIAKSVGIEKELEIKYELIDISLYELGAITRFSPYILVCTRHDGLMTDLLLNFVRLNTFSDLPIILTSQYENFVHTLHWMNNASLFIGENSAPLVLANGFPNLKKICVYTGPTDKRHWIKSPNNIYLKDPTEKNLLEKIEEII